jgi:chaperone BCS1
MYYIGFIIGFLILLRVSSLVYAAKKWWRLLEDACHAYQFFKVPQFNQRMQENQLYTKVLTYLNSLPCVEDSDIALLFSGKKSTDINLLLDSNGTLVDTFLSARVSWRNEKCEQTGSSTLVLKIRRNDKRRILCPYFQHIHTVTDEIEHRGKEVKLFINAQVEPERNRRWISVPFTHPSTIDTVLMDTDLKTKVKSDLESFLKSKQYYNRLGRIWKRSYLLYGQPGTGKSSFVAGMAKFLSYDVYDIDLSRISSNSDLKMLLLQTTNKSMIVMEDLDRYLMNKSKSLSLSGILSFMDGLVSCCGEERVMVFAMNSKDQIDPAILRPGRIDVHIQFPLCNFFGFKALAGSHLGLKEHKLFPQVEEIFEAGASLSPAEIGEIMITNRSSPTRALKSVITALQATSSKKGRRLSEVESGQAAEEAGDTGWFCRENVSTVREFRKLYGLLRLRSSKTNSVDMFLAELSRKTNSA